MAKGSSDLSAVDAFKQGVVDRLGASIKKAFIDPKNIVYDRFSSGSYLLDDELKGGYVKGKHVEFMGESGSGKAQPLSCNILTPTGFKKMGDIRYGDSVISYDGTPTTVLGVYPQGIQKVYEFTFDDGSKTRATGDHLWEVYSNKDNTPSIITTNDILREGFLKSDGGKKFKIIRNEPVQFTSNRKLELNPYLLGFLIGDGCLSDNSVMFTTVDEQILDEIRKIIVDDGLRVTFSPTTEGSISYRFKKNYKGKGKNDVSKYLGLLGLSGKTSYYKFIPEHYLYASIEDRVSLLQGLMDSDGSASSAQGELEFSTSSLKLSEDFTFLAKSLGFRCKVSSRMASYLNSAGVRVDCARSYRCRLIQQNSNIKPFRLDRKNKNYFSKYKESYYKFQFIYDIKEVEAEECQCIKVAHDSSLYITDDFIVTHNTSSCAEAVAQFQKKYPKEMIMWFDLENVLDEDYFNNIGVNIDPDKFILLRPSTGEEVFEIIREFTKSFKGGLIVIDSVPLMVPETTMEADFNQANVAAQARLMSKGLEMTMAHVSKSEATMFFINQLRVNIGNTYGDPNVTKGGKALGYYVRTRIKTSRQNSKGIAGESSGNTFELVKANYGNEKKKVETRIVYGQGIDKYSELIDFCTKLDVFEKSGSWFSYKGTKLANGKNAFIEVLKDNIELFEELEQIVRNHIKEKYEKKNGSN